MQKSLLIVSLHLRLCKCKASQLLMSHDLLWNSKNTYIQVQKLNRLAKSYLQYSLKLKNVFPMYQLYNHCFHTAVHLPLLFALLSF